MIVPSPLAADPKRTALKINENNSEILTPNNNKCNGNILLHFSFRYLYSFINLFYSFFFSLSLDTNYSFLSGCTSSRNRRSTKTILFIQNGIFFYSLIY